MIVLDASALVDVVCGRGAAEAVAGALAGQEVCAPSHQPAEVLSAVGRLERAGDLSADEAHEALRELSGLHQELVPPNPGALERAFALRARVRLLDGLYVALAARRGIPLVTTDARLQRSEPPCEIWMAT